MAINSSRNGAPAEPEQANQFLNGVATVKSFFKQTAYGLSLALLLAIAPVGRAKAQSVLAPQATGIASAVPVTAAVVNTPDQNASAQNGRVRIGAGDLLNISVFDAPEMSQTIRVNDMGDATVNLLGSMHLAELSTFEAQAAIASNLKARNFFLDPQVTVFISEYSTQGVSILGEVNKPGVYQVLGSRTMLDIISQAGGITAFAGPEAMIKHGDGSTIRVRLTKNAKESFMTDVQLAPGDKILIPRAGIVYVLGDVGRPGGFLMSNDGKISLLQAMAMAGGSNRTSSLNRAQLIRKDSPSTTGTPIKVKEILEGKLADIQLQSEDILYIPSNTAKSLIYRTAPPIAASLASAVIYAGLL